MWIGGSPAAQEVSPTDAVRDELAHDRGGAPVELLERRDVQPVRHLDVGGAGNRSATHIPSAAVVIVSSSPEITSVGTSGYSPDGGSGGAGGYDGGGTGQPVHQSMNIHFDSTCSRTVNGA